MRSSILILITGFEALIGLCYVENCPVNPMPQEVALSYEPELSPQTTSGFIRKEETGIESRFLLPEGYKRVSDQQGSFEYYLPQLPLKPEC